MIESKKGQEMFNSVSPIYERNDIMKAIFESIGNEADMSAELAGDILLQLFPQTATWGLSIWEHRLKLVTNLNENIKLRRAKVIARLQSKNKIINPKQMALIISNFTKANINILENVSPYIFELDLVSKEGFPNDLKDMYKEIKRIKPSHLGVVYKLIAITESNIYVGATSFTGEIITTYPWTPTNIESKVNVYVPIAQYAGLETITTYPKEVK